MFRPEEIERLDKSYFNVILAENYDVTIQSKNTGHIWYFHNPEYPGEGALFSINIRHLNLTTSTPDPEICGRVSRGTMCSR